MFFFSYTIFGDTMKKVIIVIFIIILIPYFIVNTFIKDENIHYEVVSNEMVRVKRKKTGNIIKVPLEEYVTHVLAGEMPVSFEDDALKAQAVAARTYVLRKKEKRKDKDYDVYDSNDDQVYLDDETLKKNWKDNYLKNINKIKKIVADTKGEYLTYNGEIVQAFFFSTSSGKTENSEEVFKTPLPYLVSVDSTWDKASPAFNSSKEMSLHDFYSKLDIKYSKNLNFKIDSYNRSGTIKTVKINDEIVKATVVRKKLGLRSANFEIKQNDSNVTIKTKGFGHGVGMSQYGALYLAQKGKKYDEILKYYYKGVEIKKM